MSSKEFFKLQVGMYITDSQDTEDAANYHRIMGFKGTKIQLQSYERHGQPFNDNIFSVDYHDIDITQKLFNSEYYSLSRR